MNFKSLKKTSKDLFLMYLEVHLWTLNPATKNTVKIYQNTCNLRHHTGAYINIHLNSKVEPEKTTTWGPLGLYGPFILQ
jgi:hypothetical protein